MKRLQTTFQLHQMPAGRHVDWLIEDPRAARPHEARLWTARCPLPPDRWFHGLAMPLVVLPPHRRVYLTYAGPIGGGRGVVRPVAKGWVQIEQWGDSRRMLHLMLPEFGGVVGMERGGAGWRAVVGGFIN